LGQNWAKKSAKALLDFAGPAVGALDGADPGKGAGVAGFAGGFGFRGYCSGKRSWLAWNAGGQRGGPGAGRVVACGARDAVGGIRGAQARVVGARLAVFAVGG